MSSLPFKLTIHVNAKKHTEKPIKPEATYSIVIEDPVQITVSTSTEEQLAAVRDAVIQLQENYTAIKIFVASRQRRLILIYDRRLITLGIVLRVIDTTIRRAAGAAIAV